MATDQCTLPFPTHKLLIFYVDTILYHSVRRLEPKQYALCVIPGICRHCKSGFVCRAHSNELNVPRAGSTELSLPYLRTIRLIGGWPPGNFQIDSGMRHKITAWYVSDLCPLESIPAQESRASGTHRTDGALRIPSLDSPTGNNTPQPPLHVGSTMKNLFAMATSDPQIHFDRVTARILIKSLTHI